MEARNAIAPVNCLVYVIATALILRCYYFLHPISAKTVRLIRIYPFITDLSARYTEPCSLIRKQCIAGWPGLVTYTGLVR